MLVCIDSPSPLSRRHAVRRSPHTKKKTTVKEAKEIRDEKDSSFIYVSEFDLTNSTDSKEVDRL